MDPSVVGRWENTPTIVPVLERIDVIERDTGEFVDVTPVMPEDLLPEASEYRVGPGDGVVVIILDFFEAGREARFEQVVDPRGYLLIPQLGEVYVNKLTRPEMEREIGEAVRAAGLLEDALVEVQVPGSRQATFSIFGVVDRVGRYLVPTPDYRLLEAITDAGGVPPAVDKIFIIRQVSLRDEDNGAADAPAPARPQPGPRTPAPVRGGRGDDQQDLLQIIQELAGPDEAPPPRPARPPQTPPPGEQPPGESDLESILDELGAPPEAGEPLPGVMRSDARSPQPARKPTRAAAGRKTGETPAPAVWARRGNDPPIDLPDSDTALPPPVPTAPSLAPPPGQSRWVFMNGRWVQVIQRIEAGGGLPEGEDPLRAAPRGEEVITQRIIEVPVQPLIQGVSQYNLVVRAGDVISVPGPRQGFVYLTGPGVARPGTYQLPFIGKLTLQRLIAAAGGLSPIAIPERVDLIRMVGDDRQAIVRLNLRAIAEGTQPDIVLKPDDLVNVGTNFWATPLAVLRGGLRATYGFGFLLDRNFGNDVFGAPPVNRFGQ